MGNCQVQNMLAHPLFFSLHVFLYLFLTFPAAASPNSNWLRLLPLFAASVPSSSSAASSSSSPSYPPPSPLPLNFFIFLRPFLSHSCFMLLLNALQPDSVLCFVYPFSVLAGTGPRIRLVGE